MNAANSWRRLLRGIKLFMAVVHLEWLVVPLEKFRDSLGSHYSFSSPIVLAGLVVTLLTFKQFGGNNQPLSSQCLATTNTGTQKFRNQK
ncbi:hypothetical protein Ppro_2278 [Pelobacter propionicus DSM 2379]|uniref:Uncharacterized protein n=2 Tax=Pelobacter propionicus TaxID=29543 RepID=A1ARB5_PELPD|nr:hypothetical protein Ppro_2278 [Pelobacter propionicus DSM 2379]